MFLARGILVSLFILEYKQDVSLGIKPQLVYDGCPLCRTYSSSTALPSCEAEGNGACAADNVSESRANDGSGRKKQGRESAEGKRGKKNWVPNGNNRRPKEPKKHTPGRGHGSKSRGKGK